MGSNLNFKNFGNNSLVEGSDGGRLPTSFSLMRQSSIYSLTFDEFQNSMGTGISKDLGSMNMDELLKNIWNAEENQTVGTTSGGRVQEGTGYLQRQGSLTLPRTLSQKTVDEVWKDMSKEYGSGKDANGSGGGAVGGLIMPQRQPTLGQMTLEDFLMRAGVVREDAHLAGKPNDVGLLGNLAGTGNNSVLFGYHPAGTNVGVMSERILENSNQIAMQSAPLPLNVNGVISTTQKLQSQQQPNPQPQPQPQPQQQLLLSKQPVLPYEARMGISSQGQYGSPGIQNGIVRVSDPAMNNNLVQSATLQGVMGTVGLGPGGGVVTAGSPAVSSVVAKSNGDASSLSPVPYVFNGGLRGRRSNALEKVVERRQKRMIKNRESAERSRARKQAYTTELEAEVAKLKEENQDLRKKQAELMEMQKNQVQEMMNQQHGSNKRRCLRWTQTGPW